MNDETISNKEVLPDEKHLADENLNEVKDPKANTETTKVSPPDFLELIYGVLFDPVQTFRKIMPDFSVKRSFFIFTLVIIVTTIMSAILMCRSLPSFGAFGSMYNLIFVIMVISLVFNYFIWFLLSGVFHLLAEFFGGQGRAIGVFIIAGMASLPLIFLIPVDLLLLLLGLKGFTLNIILFFSGLIVLIWRLVLLTLGIREVHNVSTGRAVAVVLLPIACTIVLLIFLMLAVLLPALAFSSFPL